MIWNRLTGKLNPCGDTGKIILGARANGCLKAVNSSEGKPEAIIIRGHHSPEGGCEMMKRLLRNRRNVSAVFACNDAVAFGAIRTVFEAGVRIPQGISVVGFDNVEFAALTRPPLTTINQPRYGLEPHPKSPLGHCALHLRRAEQQN
jgi:DNA-binding LacI/PurR family transcriptional regulator